MVTGSVATNHVWSYGNCHYAAVRYWWGMLSGSCVELNFEFKLANLFVCLCFMYQTQIRQQWVFYNNMQHQRLSSTYQMPSHSFGVPYQWIAMLELCSITYIISLNQINSTYLIIHLMVGWCYAIFLYTLTTTLDCWGNTNCKMVLRWQNIAPGMSLAFGD